MGYIYVAVTEHDDYQDWENLYKIGKTTKKVSDRIDDCDAAFLRAGAKVVYKKACPDGKLDAVETCVHTTLGDYREYIEVPDENGEGSTTAREWFYGASLKKIKDTIDDCIRQHTKPKK